jgi:hypothetical protein
MDKNLVLLNDQNYNRWRRQMKNVLASKDLWKYCLYQNYNDYDKSLELSIEHDHVKRENIMSLIKTEKSETTGATSTKVETPELAVRTQVAHIT